MVQVSSRLVAQYNQWVENHRASQRYALFFNLPDGVQPGQERNIEVDLTPAARQRYPDAEIRYRRVYMTPESGASPSCADGPG